MPPYVPTDWLNETPDSNPVRYTLRDSEGNILYDDLTIDVKTTVTAGTPLDSTNMNKIENGIASAMNLAENITTDQLLDGVLSADAGGRSKMADAFITLTKLSADLRFQKIAEFVGDGIGLPDWVGLPQNFRHLVMIYNGVSSRTSAGWDGLGLLVNGDASANYKSFYQVFNGTASSLNWRVTGPSAEGLLAAVLPSQNTGYLSPGSGLALFPDYSGSAYYKTCLHLATMYSAYYTEIVITHSRRDDPAAITRLSGFMNGTYVPRAGSVFSLYGFN